MSAGNRRPGGGNRGRPQRGGGNRGGRGGGRFDGTTRGPRGGAAVLTRPTGTVTLPPMMTVSELAEAIGVTPVDVIKQLMNQGIMATINQQIDYGTAAAVADSYNVDTEEAVSNLMKEATETLAERRVEGSIDPDALARPPVVTIMGHVDHGKTKLLDAIRAAKVAEGEAGGITQHIGAYQVEIQGRKITFLDTPGHEAFTAMRARGAQVTDIAVLVVAADDGVMPQTREAIAHAKAARVPIVVALNKIDLPQANPDRVKQQLSELDVIPEDYGGDTPVVEVSAREKLGIDDLLEVLLLVADIAELKANPSKPAVGVVIEAKLDRSRGVTASLLVQSGTLKPRDVIVAGGTSGRIRAMQDDRGRKLRKAEPSTPVEVLGLVQMPEAGDLFQVVDDEKVGRTLAEETSLKRRSDQLAEGRVIRLDTVFEQIGEAGMKELPLVIKADVQGSLGAIVNALSKINEENTEVTLTIVHSGTGAISESDISLAVASRAIILGFNVRPDAAARRAADTNGIDIRFYDIIYHMIDDIKAAMTGLLEPEKQEVTDGYAQVRNTFRLPSRDVVAGCYVLDGKAARNSRARVLRNGTVMTDTTVGSLKRFKEDVREVASGYECGIVLDNFNDFQEGDQIEFYHVQEVART